MTRRCLLLLLLLLTCLVIAGCAMFRSWTAIPPPGGCDQCHTVPISNDWQVSYRPAQLNDETGRYSWQQSGSVLPPPEQSSLEQKKLTEQRCFRCHKSPDQTHTRYRGRYHH